MNINGMNIIYDIVKNEYTLTGDSKTTEKKDIRVNGLTEQEFETFKYRLRKQQEKLEKRQAKVKKNQERVDVMKQVIENYENEKRRWL